MDDPKTLRHVEPGANVLRVVMADSPARVREIESEIEKCAARLAALTRELAELRSYLAVRKAFGEWAGI